MSFTCMNYVRNYNKSADLCLQPKRDKIWKNKKITDEPTRG